MGERCDARPKIASYCFSRLTRMSPRVSPVFPPVPTTDTKSPAFTATLSLVSEQTAAADVVGAPIVQVRDVAVGVVLDVVVVVKVGLVRSLIVPLAVAEKLPFPAVREILLQVSFSPDITSHVY